MRQEHFADDSSVTAISIPRTAISAWLLMAIGCASTPTRQLDRFEFSQAQMGLDFRITLFAPNEATARGAVEAAYARIAELNAVLSDYDADSELSKLSQSAGSTEWKHCSPDLWRVLETGQRIARDSKGAFDLTIGPSVNLWRRARRQQLLPSAELLTAMRDRVGYQNLELDPDRQSARLLKPDMRLDAGGIAKGYALDEALAVLRNKGINRVMIHAGGDMIFADPPPNRDGWRIELPGYGSNTVPTLLSLANRSLATSGDLFQFVEIDGVRYSHIVDPHTGIGLTNRCLVHVVAPQGILADGLSKALSVSGGEAGLRLIRQYPGAEFRLTYQNAAALPAIDSPGFSRYLASERP